MSTLNGRLPQKSPTRDPSVKRDSRPTKLFLVLRFVLIIIFIIVGILIQFYVCGCYYLIK